MMKISIYSLRWRIGFLAVLSVIAAGLVAAVGGSFVNKALVEQRMNSVRFIAESGGSIAKGFYDQAIGGYQDNNKICHRLPKELFR